MTTSLPVPFDGYRVDARFKLDHRAWNAALPDVDRRLVALEEVRDRETQLFNTGVGEVLKRIDVAVTPVIEQTKGDAEQAAEMLRQLLEQEISAEFIAQTGAKVFVSADQRAAIDAIPQTIATAIAGATRLSARAYHLSGF